MSKECFRPPPEKCETPDIRKKERRAIRKTLPLPPPNRNVWTLPATKLGKKKRGVRFGCKTKRLNKTHRGLRFLGETPAGA